MSSTTHFTSSFRNSCVSQPRDPKTKLPTTILERDSLDFANRIGAGLTNNTAPTISESVLETFQAPSSVFNQYYTQHKQENNVDDKFLSSRSNLDQKPPDIHQTSQVELKNLINDDDKFFTHLQALKAENKKTLKSLEKLYNRTQNSKISDDNFNDESRSNEFYVNKNSPNSEKKSQGENLYLNKEEENHLEQQEILENLNSSWKECRMTLCESPCHCRKTNYRSASDNYDIDLDDENDDYDNNPKQKSVLKKKNVDDDEWSDDDEDLDEQLKVRPPQNHVNILPDDHSANSFRGRSSSFDVINNMWNNFSVDEYVPYTPVKKSRDLDEWSPTVTIPEPFQMTLRDETKAKRKSKRIEKIEQEKLEKRLLEEVELQKRIRPTPVPPTTFLPLYNEFAEKEENRRKYIRDLSKRILKSTEKPFSFIKREEVKKEMKRSQSAKNVRKFQKKASERKEFKANPYPEKLFDLTWADKKAEQEEYRKIKIKLRAEETLAQSSLPSNMKTRSGTTKYFTSGEKTKRVKEELKERKKKSFKPEILDTIPDFEELHRKFERELAERKTVNNRTICEPFNLQTGKIPQRRNKFLNSMDRSEQSINTTNHRGRSQRNSNENLNKDRSRSLSWSRVQQQTPPTISHTETSKLRHERLRQSLEKSKQDDLRLTLKLKKKNRELDHLRQSVLLKAIAQDPARNRKKETKEKLQNFKMADNERRKEYETYLQDMNEKLKDRPLLFERESQTNARNKAHKRYEEILRDAGIEGDELGSFLEGESDGTSNPVSYAIAQSESESESDDVYSEQSESEQNNEDGSEVANDEDDDGSYAPPESESELNESDLEQ